MRIQGRVHMISTVFDFNASLVGYTNDTISDLLI